MPEFILRIGRFCENHVEKIVLVVVGIISAWLFFTRVIFSPSVVPFDGRTFSPGEIDRYIYEQKAPELRAKLQRRGGRAGRVYVSKLSSPIDPNDPIVADVIDRPLPNGLAGLVESPLAFIETVSVPKPRPASPATAQAGRRYRLPLIPDVTDVAASHMRAAAYVPLQEVTLQNTYDKVAVEPNDIDLVTVEARFDTSELCRRFRASFAGVDVLKEEWRDPCLADPVFAAVQLERQQQKGDGSWSGWQEVPRSRIEANRDMFKPIDRVQDLPPGGLEVRLMQFDPQIVTMGLLQPESYQIASAEEDWFPPSLYSRYKELQRRVEQDERREQQQSRQDDRTDTRSTARGGAYGTGALSGTAGGRAGRVGGGRLGTQDSAYGGSTGRGSRGGRLGTQTMPGGDQYSGTGRGSRSARRGPGAADPLYGDMGYDMMGPGNVKRRPTTDEVYFDLAGELIRYNTDLSKRDKPLLFWVFDDTAEPGGAYRYRVRLGVFNPVAGTDQLVDQDLGRKDQVILWSRYSEVTKPIEVPRRIYLFAKSVQDRTRTATVEVARYTLGYWRTEDFEVKPGEAIGREVEPKPDEKEKERERARLLAQTGGRISDPRAGLLSPMGAYGGGYMGMPNPDQANMPTIVNYTTGKVLVDLLEVSDWGSAPNLRPRMYYDMLYTGDGTTIEHMPVSMTNWPADLVRTYSDIQNDKRREPKPFRAFNKSGMRGRGSQMPGMEGYDDMGYDGMYDMGGMMPY